MPLSGNDINTLHRSYKKRSLAMYQTMHNSVLLPMLNAAYDELRLLRSLTVESAYGDEEQHDFILKHINHGAVENSYGLLGFDSGPDIGSYSTPIDSPLRIMTPRDKEQPHITFGYANRVTIPARRHDDRFPILQKLWYTNNGIRAYLAAIDIIFVTAVYAAKSTKDLHATIPDIVRGIGLGDMLKETQPPTRPRVRDARASHRKSFKNAVNTQALKVAISNTVEDGRVIFPADDAIDKLMSQINMQAIQTIAMVNLVPELDAVKVQAPTWARHYSLPPIGDYPMYSSPRANELCAIAFHPENGFIATPDGSYNTLTLEK